MGLEGLSDQEIELSLVSTYFNRIILDMKFRISTLFVVGGLLTAFAQSQFGGANGMNYKTLYEANTSFNFERMKLASQWSSKLASLVKKKGAAKSGATNDNTKSETPTKPAKVDLDTGKFKSSGTRLTIERFLDAAGVTKENRSKAKQSLLQMLDGLDQAMDEKKMKNDVFGSMSFFVCVNYAFATNKSLPSNALPVVYEQLRSLLGSKQMKGLTNVEKQTYSESLLFLTALPMVIAVASETDPAQKETLKEVAAKNLKNLLDLDASKLNLDADGLSLIP